MTASRQSPKSGPQPKRDWQPPLAAALPIRATASSWGFKWDSAWGGGKSSSVSPGRPNGPTPMATPRPRAPAASDIAGQGQWERPAVSVLPIRATANGWSWTWDHSWGGQKSSSFEPLPPKHSTDESSMAGTAEKASDALARLWQAPAMDVLSVAATANGWSWTWDHSWGGQKSSSFEPLPPKHSTDESSMAGTAEKASDALARLWQAPAMDVLSVAATANSWSWTWDHSWGGQKSSSFEPAPPKRSTGAAGSDGAASVARVSDTLGQLWQAPSVNVLPVRATAHTFGIKWDLYLGGGKMEGLRPQAPPPLLPTASIGTSAVRARMQGRAAFWQAPAVAALPIRATRAKGV